MQVRRFEAPNMAQALEQVRSELGPEAVIISSRKRRTRGVLGRARERVEVIAGTTDGIPGPAPAGGGREADEAPRGVAGPGGTPPAARRGAAVAAFGASAMGRAIRRTTPDGAARLEISAEAAEAARAASAASPSSTLEAPPGLASTRFRAFQAILPRIDAKGMITAAKEQAEALVAEPGAERAPAPGAAAPVTVTTGVEHDPHALAALRQEVAEIRRLIQAQAAAGDPDAPALPSAAVAYLDLLHAAAVPEALVERVRADTAPLLDPDGDGDAAVSALRQTLLGLLPAAASPTFEAGKAAVVHVLGTPGAGKTLAAVRLARRLHEAEGHPVVLVNADQRRPGAGQQLQAYAEALALPFAMAYEPSDLKRLAGEHEEAILVVDTGGALPVGAAAQTLLKGWVQATRRRTVLLAADATAKEGDLVRACAAFAAAKPAGVILTKTDLTTSLGPALGFLARAPAPLLFLSRGADALDDIEAAGPAALLEAALDAAQQAMVTEAVRVAS